ncbi:hypothetical protein [Deinococcus sp. RM]|uniref:hypothetical protein n=1 Tax=Deinococcus sp. RM TaxID=2316359 RepID=UPI003AB49355
MRTGAVCWGVWLLGGAHAACLPMSASVETDPYDALRGAHPTLAVTVTCARPGDRFRLDLGVLESGAGALRLVGPGGTLLATVGADGAAWRGERRGTQVVRVPLNILSGQWVAGGTYRAALEVTVVNTRQETP